MENLIRLESGEIALNPRISSQIAAFERAMKNLKEKEDALKTAILREMEAAGCIKVMTDDHLRRSDRPGDIRQQGIPQGLSRSL